MTDPHGNELRYRFYEQHVRDCIDSQANQERIDRENMKRKVQDILQYIGTDPEVLAELKRILGIPVK